ncbi:MAG TPA: dTMP kinase [Bacteroidales bacterium]|nr:dTMP kinase [Bacteroidales bacterium]HNR43238.1 dTMP kinase [Bacteroidales bacterium]HQG78370.1 dTMP kinase [Bacteroidales bacterium]
MKLFVIEGLDGSGKSTQLSLLREFFTRKGYASEYLHFPRTDSPFFGELISRFLRGEFGSLAQVDPYLVAMLFAGDRMDASGKIKAWLGSGKAVFLDRYTYSNIAYQCAKLDDENDREKLMNWILSLEFGHFAIPRPGLNIFLDVPGSFTKQNLLPGRPGHGRKYLNGGNDIHEGSLRFQEKVRDIYIKIAERDETMIVLNCSDNNGEILSPGIISERIIKLITDRKLI